MFNFVEKCKAVVVGHAVGDALGVPVEFSKRSYLKKHPVTEMLEYGTYEVPKGSWSDDTSMSLCALDSLAKGSIDFDDIMENFGKWYYRDEFTPTGFAFDMGNTCSMAIFNYFANKLPYDKCGLSDDYSNGNGSLMRIHPFVLYLANKNLTIKEKIGIIDTASALTHAHTRSTIACGIYAFILWELLKNPDKSSIKLGMNKALEYYLALKENDIAVREELQLGKFDNLFGRILNDYDRQWEDGKENEDFIQSHGYIMHTIEASIWCLLTTDSYAECVLKAVNLGHDTDTTAAVAGGLAGALYGYDAIPEEWRKNLKRRDYIEELCDKTFSQN